MKKEKKDGVSIEMTSVQGNAARLELARLPTHAKYQGTVTLDDGRSSIMPSCCCSFNFGKKKKEKKRNLRDRRRDQREATIRRTHEFVMWWIKPLSDELQMTNYTLCAMWWITIGCLYFFVMMLIRQVETSGMVGGAAWLFFCLFGHMRVLSLNLYEIPEACVLVQFPQVVFWISCLFFCTGPVFALVSGLAFIIGFLLLGLPCLPFGTSLEDSVEAAVEAALIFSHVICWMVTGIFFVLFPLFVGTIYLLTNHYTTNGLVLVFVFLPPVVWPVSYIYLVRSTILIFLLVFMPLTILLTKKMLPLLLTASS